MNFSHSYEQELESLILETLLPVYEKYQRSRGIKNPLDGLNDKLLRKVRHPKKLPALLRPKEKYT